jgi:mono/diheme cytochrome c family protein
VQALRGRVDVRLALIWTVRVVVALVVVVVIALAVVFIASQRALTQQIATPAITTLDLSHADVARGDHLMRSMVSCIHCHGADLGGQVFFNDPTLAVLYAPNLTSGHGGFLATHTDEDFIRAVRYGVGPDGRPLLVMPSNAFISLSDSDLADILAYVHSRPNVDNTTPAPAIGILGRVLIATGALPFPAIEVQRSQLMPMHPVVGVSAAYGQYLVRISGCTSCHGAGLTGGHLEGAPSDPPAQNLTPAGDLGHWTLAQFTNTIRTGTRPDGTRVNDFMPWTDFAQMSDDELHAIWLYLRTVPPQPTGHG